MSPMNAGGCCQSTSSSTRVCFRLYNWRHEDSNLKCSALQTSFLFYTGTMFPGAHPSRSLSSLLYIADETFAPLSLAGLLQWLRLIFLSLWPCWSPSGSTVCCMVSTVFRVTVSRVSTEIQRQECTSYFSSGGSLYDDKVLDLRHITP